MTDNVIDYPKLAVSILNAIDLGPGTKSALTSRIRWSIRLMLNIVLYLDKEVKPSYDQFAVSNAWVKGHVGAMDKLISVPMYDWFKNNMAMGNGVRTIASFDSIESQGTDLSKVSHFIESAYDMLDDLDKRAAARKAIQSCR